MQTLLRLIMQSHTLVHGQRLMLSSTSAPRIKLMKGGIYDGDFLCFLVFSVEICVYSPVEVFTKGTKHLLMNPGAASVPSWRLGFVRCPRGYGPPRIRSPRPKSASGFVPPAQIR